MAEWSYGVNDAATVKQYSRRLFIQAVPNTLAWKLASLGSSPDDPNNIVQFFDETQKREGDTIKYDLLANLSGEGTLGDNEISGTEESPVTHQDSFVIDQLRHAVLVKGAMSQQRVPFNKRDQAKRLLSTWWEERYDLSLINQLSGNSIQTNIKYTGLQAVVAPDSGHQIYGGGRTTAATLVSGDKFTLDLIDKCVAKAHTMATPIKPIKLKGMELFGVMLLHPFQTRSLRENYSSGQWGDIQKAAMSGGQITGNPIFNGAIGLYGNVLLHEDARMPWGSVAQAGRNPLGLGGNSGGAGDGTSISRAVFLGAQAAAMGFGRAYDVSTRFKWFEELLDAGNQLRVTAGSIFGIKKTRFNSLDYATIAVDTFDAAS